MSRIFLLILPLLSTGCAAIPSGPAASGTDGDDAPSNRISLLLGARELDDDYEPVEAQSMLGFEYVHESPDSFIGFEAGIAASAAEDEAAGIDIEGSSSEIYAGLRKSFGSGLVRPYVGAGVALIRTAIDPENAPSDDGGSLAGYAHGGAELWLGPRWYAGLDLRFLFASDIQYEFRDTDGDYGQIALFIGFGF